MIVLLLYAFVFCLNLPVQLTVALVEAVKSNKNTNNLFIIITRSKGIQLAITTA